MDQHVSPLITDYALGLLSAEERRRVEGHARVCDACREALRRECGVASLVRGAVYQAAAPAPGRLAALRPAARPRVAAMPLYRRLAPVTLVTVLLALGLLFGRDGGPFAPAAYADGTPTMTATRTQTPTATLAAAPDADPLTGKSRAAESRTAESGVRPAPSPALHDTQTQGPSPAATPIITAAAP